MFQNKKRILITCLSGFCFLGNMFAQGLNNPNLLVHKENANILVRGFENPVSVSSDIGGEYSLTNKSGAVIKKKNNYYTIDPKSVKDDTLLVEIISKKDPNVQSLIRFKVIDIPTPEVYFGSIKPNSNLNKEKFLAQQQLVAIIDDFFIEGLKFSIKSFTVNYIDHSTDILSIKRLKIEGSSLSRVYEIVKQLPSGEEIEFTEIEISSPYKKFYINNIVVTFQSL
jgi:hypothetical protein